MSEKDKKGKFESINSSARRTVIRSIVIACGMFAFGFAMVSLV